LTDADVPIPPTDGERTVLGCRVSQDVQDRFGDFVTEMFDNRKGAYGYCVEQAMKEYMDNDRYARVDDEVKEVRRTVKETNAMVRRIITAEKEKGAFLEAAPTGNQAGDRLERENAVVRELTRQCVVEGHERRFKESELNGTITEVANVASEPSKRDYRDSLIDRGMIEQKFSKCRLTDAGLNLAGYEVQA